MTKSLFTAPSLPVIGGVCTLLFLSAITGLAKADNTNLVGPAPLNVVMMGDSITEGVGGNPSGANQSMMAVVQSLGMGAGGARMYDLGFRQEVTGYCAAQYNGGIFNTSGVTTTIATVSGSPTATVTGTTTGIINGMAIGSPNTPPDTTTTLSGTTLSLSRPATATGSCSASLQQAPTNVFYGELYPGGAANGWSNYHGTAHLLSPAVTGIPGILIILLGANDYYCPNVPATVALTTGSSTGTITSDVSAIPTGSHSYSVGGSGISQGTTYSLSGVTLTLSQPAIASGSFNLNFETSTAPVTSLTDWEQSYSYIVSAAKADGYTVVACTLLPAGDQPGQGTANSNANRIIFNNWLQADTVGAHYVFDLASQMAPWPITASNSYYADLLHPSVSGDALLGQYINAQCFSQIFPSIAIPVINSPTSAVGMVAGAFNYQITATKNPTSYNAAGLPAGLGINTSTGLISGTPTPTATGTSNVTITATNIATSSQANLAMTIYPFTNPPAITNAPTASATTGTPFSYQITASNTPTNYGATDLPAGLSIDPVSGLISGTPTLAGTSNVTISATNIGGTTQATWTLTTLTNLSLHLTTVSALTSLSGSPATNANDGNAATRWTAGFAFYPQWWVVDLGTLNNVSRVDVNWFANTNHAYTYRIETSTDNKAFTIVVPSTTDKTLGLTSNSFTPVNARYVRLYIISSPTGSASFYEASVFGLPPAVIEGPATFSGVNGAAFSYQVRAINGVTSYKATGLPAGLTIDPVTGLISGVATQTGTFSVTITVTNPVGTVTSILTLTVAAAPLGPPIDTPTLPQWALLILAVSLFTAARRFILPCSVPLTEHP